MHEDTIATYQDGEKTYEIDHLGISSPEQWASPWSTAGAR